MASLNVAGPTPAVAVGTAGLRNAVLAFESNLVSVCGLVKVVSTGQIDLTTYTPASTATGTVHGWSMFRFNDLLQSSAPIFIRIEYRSGAEAAGLDVQFRVGTAHDGAGVLTENATAQLAGNASMVNGTVAPSRVIPIAYHGGTGRMAIAGSFNVNGSPLTSRNFFLFGVDRTRNNAGNYTDEGFTVVVGSTTQHVVIGEPSAPTQTRWHAVASSRTGGSRFNNRYPIGVIQPFHGRAVGTLTVFGVGDPAEYGSAEIVQVDAPNGQILYYRGIDIGDAQTTTLNTRSRTNMRILMRWD